MHPLTRLSEHFTFKDLYRSNTADRLGIDNIPKTQEEIDNLTFIANNILEPIHDNYQPRQVYIGSGFRSLELNRALKSSDNSQHVSGEAIDVEVQGIDNYELANWIEDHLEYDQLILEFYNGVDPASGWVHVSTKPEGSLREETLTINKGNIKSGLHKGS